MVDESGKCILPKTENRKSSDHLRNDDVNSNEIEDSSNKSVSTTSDSQVCIDLFTSVFLILNTNYECLLHFVF